MSTAEPPVAAARTPGRSGVQSVDRALDLLEVLAASEQPLGVSELAARTGLAEGTAHRLLRALVHRGYVAQDSARKYGLGTAALVLGDASSRSLARGAQPFLRQMVDVSGETANLAVLDGDRVVYVAQAASPRRLRMFAEVGRSVPAHSTAVGKVLVAALPERTAAALVERAGLPRRTGRTLVDPDAFAAELRRTRERGWALDDGEEEDGVRCVAVPVVTRGRTVAAASVSGPADRLPLEGLDDLAVRLRRVADAFAASLA